MNAKRGGLKSIKGFENRNSAKFDTKVKRGRKPKLSEKQKEKVAELYLEGYSTKEIGEFFNISGMTVYRVVNTYIKENFSGSSFDEVFEKVKAKMWS